MEEPCVYYCHVTSCFNREIKAVERLHRKSLQVAILKSCQM